MGGATDGAAFAVSVFAGGVLAAGLGCVDAIGVSVGPLLVAALLEVATGSLLIGAAGAGVELLMAGSGATVALLAFTLAVVFDEVAATFASGLDDFVLRLGAGVGTGAGAASATLAGSSRAVGAVVDETSFAAGAPSAPALLAVCAAGAGTLISLFLTLWSNSSAPPMTEAVMIPNASPKWFIGFSRPALRSMWDRGRVRALPSGRQNPTCPTPS